MAKFEVGDKVRYNGNGTHYFAPDTPMTGVVEKQFSKSEFPLDELQGKESYRVNCGLHKWIIDADDLELVAPS